MKVLIFGPSGAGKTYVSSKLKESNYNAVDADTIKGLSSWYDGLGNTVPYPEDADEAFLDKHSFLWNREFLRNYLRDKPDIFILGSAGNIFEMLDLFDKVYFLKIDSHTQKERLMHESRENPMGKTEFQRESAVAWGKQLEERAKRRHIQFIDASLSPEEIIDIIRR